MLSALFDHPIDLTPSSEDDGDAANGNEAALHDPSEYFMVYCTRRGKGTHDVVVLAAHRVGRALVAGGHANDGNGRAAETDERVDALEDDAEQA